MTRKDYWKFAAMLSYSRPNRNTESTLFAFWAARVKQVADIFQEDNPRFNRERFYEACGLEE